MFAARDKRELFVYDVIKFINPMNLLEHALIKVGHILRIFLNRCEYNITVKQSHIL